MISRKEKKRTWLWGSTGLVLFLCLLSGCAGISPESGSDLLWSGEAQSLQEASGDEQGSMAQEDDGQVQGIPFRLTPEIPEYVMPSEDYADPLDREASEIIDGAICKAIAAVSVMKDDRHSKVVYPYEEDPHGYTARFSEDQRGLYDYIVEKGRALEAFHVTKESYGRDPVMDYLTISGPIWQCNPDLDSYLYLDIVTDREGVIACYFDPDQGAYSSSAAENNDRDQVRHDILLMNHIAKRIVDKMPEYLSAYDRYYYLAAVLSEHVTYDREPKNAHTAYGALVCGRAVCEGYSEAYALLCREADLWCAYRWGYPGGDERHQWNMVKLESGIYNVDVTWCDKVECYRPGWYDYFMLSDEEFENHGITEGIEGTGSYEPNPYQ